MLRVTSLRKTFPAQVPPWRALLPRPPRVRILDGITFTVGAGTVLGVLGANGAGKSTLLQIIAGLIRPDHGEVVADGSVGLCSSADRSFYYRLTVRENLKFFGSLLGLRGDALRRRIDDVLRSTDLLAIGDRLFSRCSSGMRQRVTIARALLNDPSIVLLDEPTRALDPVHTDALRTLIRDRLVREQRKTVVLATNVLEEAWATCDRVALLNEGELVAIDTPERLRERAATTVEREAISAASLFAMRGT